MVCLSCRGWGHAAEDEGTISESGLGIISWWDTSGEEEGEEMEGEGEGEAMEA